MFLDGWAHIWFYTPLHRQLQPGAQHTEGSNICCELAAYVNEAIDPGIKEWTGLLRLLLQIRTSRPKPTKEKEKERLCCDVSASDLEDHRVNLLEGPMVSLQTLEGT